METNTELWNSMIPVKRKGKGVIIPSRKKLVAALFSFSINKIIAAYVKGINIAIAEKITIISNML